MRRSKAVGILGQPAVALQLLIDHRDDPDTRGETAEPQPDDLDHEPDTDDDEPEVDAGSAPRTAGGEPGDGVHVEDGRGKVAADGHQSLDLAPLTTGGDVASDLGAARPRVVLNVHVNEATLQAGHGLVRPDPSRHCDGQAWTLAEFTTWLTEHRCHVTVRPVYDPAHLAPVDGYETPTRMRAALQIRQPAEVFPYGVATSAHLDCDHTRPYVPLSRGGPPGQTGLGNLGPLSRASHRAVTSGGWRRRQPEPGRSVFRSPAGYVYLVTNQGTLPLGRNPFADRTWHAATPSAALAA